ncbi:MAG TPA: MoxR family ATPase [Pirellulales bacterium]
MSIEPLYRTLRDEVAKVVYGQDQLIDFALAGLFSGGHVLLEGPPGTAKTLLVRTIAAALNMSYRRVQMTPDLMPNDITGSAIYREDQHKFEFRPGPIFANFLLADEVNRASARTQSAMLEAMQELGVTYDGVTFPLPQPFITFATENPIEQEGTYPLPLAQLDRFMFKVLVGYPPETEELRVLREHHATGGQSNPTAMGVAAVVQPAELLEAREIIRKTFIREEVIGYVRNLLHATRTDDALSVGGSPRAGLMVLMAAKSLARFAGREFVTPDDVKQSFIPAMRHRVVLSPAAELDGAEVDAVLGGILESVEVPR